MLEHEALAGIHVRNAVVTGRPVGVLAHLACAFERYGGRHKGPSLLVVELRLGHDDGERLPLFEVDRVCQRGREVTGVQRVELRVGGCGLRAALGVRRVGKAGVHVDGHAHGRRRDPDTYAFQPLVAR